MQLDAQQIENTLYFEKDSAVGPADLTGLNSDLFLWWTDNYSGLVTSQVELREIVSTDLTTATSGQAIRSGSGELGTDGFSAVPSNVALTVAFKTGSRGRSFRGRNYISGIASTELATQNSFESSYLTSVQTAYELLLTGTVDASLTWVVLSRFSGVDPTTHEPIPRVAAVATPITTVTFADNVVDSMRRRLPGRGA